MPCVLPAFIIGWFSTSATEFRVCFTYTGTRDTMWTNPNNELRGTAPAPQNIHPIRSNKPGSDRSWSDLDSITHLPTHSPYSREYGVYDGDPCIHYVCSSSFSSSFFSWFVHESPFSSRCVGGARSWNGGVRPEIAACTVLRDCTDNSLGARNGQLRTGGHGASGDDRAPCK